MLSPPEELLELDDDELEEELLLEEELEDELLELELEEEELELVEELELLITIPLEELLLELELDELLELLLELEEELLELVSGLNCPPQAATAADSTTTVAARLGKSLVKFKSKFDIVFSLLHKHECLEWIKVLLELFIGTTDGK